MEYKSFQLKKTDVGESGVFEGYLSTFNNVDSYNDVIKPGAFKKTIAENGTFPILWQHNTEVPIGVFPTLREDDYGLLVKGEINMETQQGKEAYSLLKQGALNGLSIGFVPIKTSWEGDMRNIHEIRLWEGSLVTFPANELATVSHVKSLQQFELVLKGILGMHDEDIMTRTDEKLVKAASDKLLRLLDSHKNDKDTLADEPSIDTRDITQEPSELANVLKQIREMR